MADLKKSVEIVFGGKNELSGTIGKVGKDFDSLGSSITGVSGPLDSLTDNILLAEAAFAGLALAGMGLAIKTAGDFNAKFGEITTLISATGAPIDKFKADIKSYATNSVKSIDAINQAIYTAVSAGVDYKDSIAFITQAEKLSVAGRLDLGDTTKVLISVLNAYGMSTDKAERISDVMFQTVRSGLTTMTELSQSLAQVTGLAANAGIPFETLSAAIAALTTTGMPTSQAISSLKAAISNIISPTGEAEKTAKSLGIQFNATALQTKGFENVLWSAQTATKGNVEKMANLFGSVEALNAVMILAADTNGKFKSSLEEIGKSAGATQTAYSKVADEFTNINTRLENSFKVTLGEIGEKLMPQYSNIATALADLMKGVKVGIDSGAFDPLFKALDGYGKQIADTIRLIAQNIPEALKGLDFSGLIKSLEGLGGSLGEAFGKIFGNIDLSTAEGLRDVIQRIIDSFAALTNVTKGIVDGMGPLFKLIGEGIDKFSKLDESSAGLVGNILGMAKSINILAEYSGTLTAVLTLLSGKALVDTSLAIWKLGASSLEVIPAMGKLISTLGLAGMGAVGVAAAFGGVVGSYLNQNESVGNLSQKFLGLIDVNKNFFGAQAKTKEEMEKVNKQFDAAVGKHKALTDGTGETTAATGKFGKAMSALDLTKAQKAFDDLNASLKKTRDDLEAAAKLKDLNVSIKFLADGTSIETTKDMIYKTFPDGKMLITNIGTKTDAANLAVTKKTIDDAIPQEKLIEIQAKIDTEKIKTAGETIQKSIEWKAKIDIAQVESATKKMEAAFKSIDNTVTNTGETLSSIIGAFAKVGTGSAGDKIFEEIKNESVRRDKALELQDKLINAQIAEMTARTDAMKKGDALIKIDGKGLQPHLEAFMFEVLKAIQIRANAEGQKFLVGL